MKPRALFIAAVTVLAAAPAIAVQSAPAPPAPPTRAAAPPSDAGQIPVHPGAQVSAAGEVWETTGADLKVRDVTVATLTPFLPAAAQADGLAVIIAPGGGFVHLSMQTEGYAVARWLAARGIAAFVLKYSLKHTPAVMPKSPRPPLADRNAAPAVNTSPAAVQAQEDALAAISLVRQRAGQFHVDPARIGMIGFSAGAVTAMNVATAYTAASRPDFVASIYGEMPDRPVPADAPPLFAAVAADDPLMANAAYPMFMAWRAAGKSAELHIYQAGKHGFGMVMHGTTSDHWIDEFYWWLQSEGLLRKPG
jgi:acetyl esterase/lipase